jgi:hypothetical protein
MGPRKKRLLLVAAALPFLAVLIIGPVQAQFRPPGGNLPNIPRPTFPQPPNFPHNPGANLPKIPRPTFPQGPGINLPQNPGMNMPQIPGIIPQGPRINVPLQPQIIQEWKCNGCGASLGRGNLPVSPCPSCKARIINGRNADGTPGILAGRNAPPAVQFPAPPGNSGRPAAVHNPAGIQASGGLKSAQVVYALGAFAGLAMMIGGIITAVKCAA